MWQESDTTSTVDPDSVAGSVTSQAAHAVRGRKNQNDQFCNVIPTVGRERSKLPDGDVRGRLRMWEMASGGSAEFA